MIEISPKDYKDEDYDSCANTTIAVLKINGIKIPLCGKCVESLSNSLKKFNDTIFCHMCNNFVMSKSGWRYGGTCLNELSEDQRKNFNPKDAGYICRVDCMNTCSNAERIIK